MFFVIRKNHIILASLLILTLLSAICFSFNTKDENLRLCSNFIKSIGYSFEQTPYETSLITIPEGFGKVYENYNSIQKEAGFDLTPLRGKTVMRYTFTLKNSEYSIINILISDGKICGGDIMNPSSSGKMIPLLPKNNH